MSALWFLWALWHWHQFFFLVEMCGTGSRLGNSTGLGKISIFICYSFLVLAIGSGPASVSVSQVLIHTQSVLHSLIPFLSLSLSLSLALPGWCTSPACQSAQWSGATPAVCCLPTWSGSSTLSPYILNSGALPVCWTLLPGTWLSPTYCLLYGL